MQLGYGGRLLGLDGGVRLLDHRRSLDLRLVGDVGLHGLAGLLGVSDDLGGLALRVLQLALVLLEHALALDPGLLGLLKGVLDELLALLQHALELRPAELQQHDGDHDEADEHGDELRHVRQDRRYAGRLAFGRERERRGREREAACGDRDEPDAGPRCPRLFFHVVTSLQPHAAFSR